MFLATIIEKGLKTYIQELNTPYSFKIGSSFEKYVRTTLFPGENFKLIEKPHNYTEDPFDIPESTTNPDFKLRDLETNKEFYLEAKFRSRLYNEKIKWTYSKQLNRYKERNKDLPVFILLGLGNTPENPCRLFLIPLNEVKYIGIYLSLARKHEIPKDTVISSELLWSKLA